MAFESLRNLVWPEYIGSTAALNVAISRWFRRCRIGIRLLLAMLTGLAGAAGFATPINADAVVRLLQEQDAAVLRVGERLAVSGLALCGKPGRSAGMTVQRLSQYGADYRPAAVRVLGLDARPTITGVVAGGAAAAAGLRPGDVVTAIGGTVFEPVAPVRADGDFHATADALNVIDAALADGATTVTLLRDGAARTITLRSRPACRARFDVRAGRSNNASSDGVTVQVSSDLVAQARGDEELAAIMAHELAHNILRHPQRLTGPRPRPRVRDTETEADRLSVYLLDAAGYPSTAAAGFWARWGRANDYGIFADGTHPGWKNRRRTIETEAAAIAAQRAAGEPVRPPADLAPR